MPPKKLLCGLLMTASVLLSGCNAVLLHPEGDVALQQRNLIYVSTVLMLLVIVPVIALTLFFAWRYRASNKKAEYTPDWHHSTVLELVIWSAPLIIIIALGALTWVSTHKLDPYRPLERLSEGRPVSADNRPLVVDVVALDWKWLFIYPEQGIATVNELAAPIDRPIEFRITAATVMNSFFIPSLAGQIYAMPGMETTLHAVMNKVGVYDGFSANFSGDGFSGMHFQFHGVSAKDFDAWVQQAHNSTDKLDLDAYQHLATPSENDPVHLYSDVTPKLFDAIVNQCVEPGKDCMHGMTGMNAQDSMDMSANHATSAPVTAAGDPSSASAAAPAGHAL